MAIFDRKVFEESTLHQDVWRRLETRFDTALHAEGLALWRDFVRSLWELAAQASTSDGLVRLLSALEAFVRSISLLPSPSGKTVFVSHQRDDAKWAERVAWEATEAGFDYWLDIHDVTLTGVDESLLPLPVKAALIAGIIEMALLNCSHLVSLQTVNSRGSRWVPYEFGRAKQRQLIATRTASWFQTGVDPDPAGDYLSLAVCLPTKGDLVQWLAHAAGPVRPPKPNRIWRQLTPDDLPN